MILPATKLKNEDFSHTSNNWLSTSTTQSARLFEIMCLTEEVAIFGGIKGAVQLSLAFVTGEAGVGVETLVQRIHSGPNDGFATLTTGRTEALRSE